MNMSKILVLGSSGFIGKCLVEELDGTPITRKEVNLLDVNSVKKLIKNHKPDVVINCATNPDVTMTSFNNKAFIENVSIFRNLYRIKEEVNKIICFGSGAEFNRSYSIDSAKEQSVFSTLPKDHYGLSKNIIARSIQRDNSNLYNLRLFGCFHQSEAETRLLKQVLTGELTISDRYFDYFWLNDLLSVVKYYIENENLPKDINLVYNNKITIEKFINLFAEIKGIKLNYSANKSDKNYTGCSDKLYSLNIELKGIKAGLEKYEI